ncbi:MAG: S8 family peptidase [Bacteroidota bacterium]
MISRRMHVKKEVIRAFFILTFFYSFAYLSGQEKQYIYFYRVYFSDKGIYTPSDFSASDLLSERAIERRTRDNIECPDMRDLPVFPDYIRSVASLGLTLHSTSRWMNTGLFKSDKPADTSQILFFPFVAEVKMVKSPLTKGSSSDKLDFPMYGADPSAYDRPVAMLNGQALHGSGFDGDGVLIAVLDGGFFNGNLISSLQHLRNRKGIKATYDFISNDTYVYDYHYHGTAVLSVLAGILEGLIEGSAPGADFLLLRTEDTMSEFPVEEDFWAAGAEFADSAGADIISSSLGYFTFDDPSLNYQFRDFDGDRAFVTRAADIAASKGILVLASAGNERNKTWKRILAPSDGDSVISVGAVDGNNLISAFSSAGFSADGRVKPDNAAMGVSLPVQTETAVTGRSSGTSFSCPVLSGMAACLMQAVPDARNTEIIDALHSSADRYTMPDSLYGYGIPDLLKALERLQELRVNKPGEESLAWPNPTRGSLEIIFRDPPGSVKIEIFNSLGRVFCTRDFREYAGRSLPVTELQNRQGGVYFIRIITDRGTFTHKIIRLSN